MSPLASNAIMLHLIGYAFTNMAVFVGVIAFFNMTGKEEIADFAGLADRHPFIAASIAIGMFSLAGLPIFAGFVTKFYLFIAAANEGLLWLASIAVVYSVVSLYYYLMVIRQMYIQPAASQVEEEHGIPSPAGASLDAPEEGVELEDQGNRLAVEADNRSAGGDGHRLDICGSIPVPHSGSSGRRHRSHPSLTPGLASDCAENSNSGL